MGTEPKVVKAHSITGHKLTFRNANPSDAEFILRLRLDPGKSQHLSTVSSDIQAQVAWLKDYSEVGDQAYFIISEGFQDIGTIRLYGPVGSSFCWGSWIIADNAPATAAIESALILYSYGLDVLGFSNAHFDVRRDNHRVIAFHKRFGAIQVGETDKDCYFTISAEAIRSAMARYRKFLPEGIRVKTLT